MKAYHDILQNVLDNGVWQENRTGIRTKMVPGLMFKHDMSEGFPAVTTKKLAFKSVVAELLGFLRGYTSAEQFRTLGSKIWDQNANENQAWLENPHRGGLDDLGRIYGAQWRSWVRSPSKNDPRAILDQIEVLLDQIESNPSSRRLLVSAWRPDEFERMALPPCHYAFQIIIEQESKKMHLTWNQRSVDTFLGMPFNIASYATLLQIFAEVTGYVPGTLTGFLADVHIYENHLDQVKEQLNRKPFPLPSLNIDFSEVDRLNEKLEPREGKLTLLQELLVLVPDDFQLKGYEHHPAIKAPMAV